MIDITLYSVVAFVVALIIFNLSLMIFLGSRDYSSRAFAFSIFFVAFWVALRGIFHSIDPTAPALQLFNTTLSPILGSTIINKISFFVGGIVASGFLLFSLSFPSNTYYPRTRSLLIILFIAHTALYMFPNLFLGQTFYIQETNTWGWHQGNLIRLYDLYFFTLWLAGLFLIARKASVLTGIEKKRVVYVFWAMFIGLLPLTIFTMILPRFGIFEYEWLSSLCMLLWPSVIGYSILKHNQMNVRTVYAELLIVGLSLMLFVYIFI